MKALIIEDEIPSSRRLARMLSELEIEVVVELSSVSQAKQWLKKHPHPEVLFVDIRLGDGLIFEIFSEIEINSYIIFTTAYDMYALKAFEYKSIVYLLKPITRKKLKEAVTKVNNFAMVSETHEIETLLANSQEQKLKSNFAVKIGRKIKIVTLNEIDCFCSEHNTTFIKTIHNQSFPIDFSLTALEEILPKHNFVRVNRKCIVHKKQLKEISAYTNSRLRIELNHFKEEIIVSRERVKDFKNWLR